MNKGTYFGRFNQFWKEVTLEEPAISISFFLGGLGTPPPRYKQQHLRFAYVGRFLQLGTIPVEALAPPLTVGRGLSWSLLQESTLAEKKAAKYDVGLEERIRCACDPSSPCWTALGTHEGVNIMLC